MTDLAQTPPSTLELLKTRLATPWLITLGAPVLVAILDYVNFFPVLEFATGAFLGTLPYITFAVILIAGLKAAGAETMIAEAFKGREVRMIFLAAMFGGLAPFCSCEVIPFIAALLALGAPLSAVMAFWLSSPLMDPAMFLITTGTLGLDFAIAKTVGAVGMGLLGGYIVRTFAATPVFANPLREAPAAQGCGCGTNPFTGTPEWAFWTDDIRRATFRTTATENALFLGKWLLLAYLIEAVMLKYVPAEWIAGVLGGEGVGTILLAALVGAPAYLNGYAAVPLVDALLNQGMSDGAAMAFVIAGGVSCIPAAIAVWALVRPRVFAAYLGFAFVGSLTAGILWQAVA